MPRLLENPGSHLRDFPQLCPSRWPNGSRNEPASEVGLLDSPAGKFPDRGARSASRPTPDAVLRRLLRGVLGTTGQWQQCPEMSRRMAPVPSRQPDSNGHCITPPTPSPHRDAIHLSLTVWSRFADGVTNAGSSEVTAMKHYGPIGRREQPCPDDSVSARIQR